MANPTTILVSTLTFSAPIESRDSGPTQSYCLVEILSRLSYHNVKQDWMLKVSYYYRERIQSKQIKNGKVNIYTYIYMRVSYLKEERDLGHSRKSNMIRKEIKCLNILDHSNKISLAIKILCTQRKLAIQIVSTIYW